MTKKIQETQVVLRIANSDIILGDDYVITGKPDKDAPEGFATHETSKYLTVGNGEYHAVPFDDETSTFDTGFEEDSPCNYPIKEGKKEAVANYVKYIKEPYEKKYKKELDSTSNFWDDYGFMISQNKVYRTRNIKDLMELFHALSKGYICEKGEKDPYLQTAKYLLINNNKKQSATENRAINKLNAYDNFNALKVNINKSDDLFLVLDWISIPKAREIVENTKDLGVLNKTVALYFEHPATGNDNCIKFNQACELIKDKISKQELLTYSSLLTLKEKNKLQKRNGYYYLHEHLIGSSLKQGAKVSLTEGKKDLAKAIEEEIAKI